MEAKKLHRSMDADFNEWTDRTTHLNMYTHWRLR